MVEGPRPATRPPKSSASVGGDASDIDDAQVHTLIDSVSGDHEGSTHFRMRGGIPMRAAGLDLTHDGSIDKVTSYEPEFQVPRGMG